MNDADEIARLEKVIAWFRLQANTDEARAKDLEDRLAQLKKGNADGTKIIS
jgi:hypothetical protein